MDDARTPASPNNAELVIDAIFGAGLSRALVGSPAEILAVAANLELPIVAIDVPGGMIAEDFPGGLPIVLRRLFE